MSHQLHLNKNGSGMAARTACGRNILRTPLSTDWAGFTATPRAYRCERCASSKQAGLNASRDLERAAEGDWIPEDPDAWKAADDALIASRRAR